MTRIEMLKELRKDLRSLGKYQTLNKAYGYTAESGLERGLCFKGGKGYIMDMKIINPDRSLVCHTGGLWDVAQKVIIARADEVTAQIN